MIKQDDVILDTHLAYEFRSFMVGNGFVSPFLYKLLQVGTRNEDSDVILTHTDRLDNMETNFGLALGCTRGQHLRNFQYVRSYYVPRPSSLA
jgi:hypothetical protein